jgi:hypothetical protein
MPATRRPAVKAARQAAATKRFSKKPAMKQITRNQARVLKNAPTRSKAKGRGYNVSDN